MKASDILNEYPEERLAQLFWLYGELQNGRQVAAAIGRARKNNRLETVTQLLDAIRPVIGREREKKDTAKLFQALRMEVNHEVDALREMLTGAVGLLDKGGRLVVITYRGLRAGVPLSALSPPGLRERRHRPQRSRRRDTS